MDQQGSGRDDGWPIIRPAWASGRTADELQHERWSIYLPLVGGLLLPFFCIWAGCVGVFFKFMPPDESPQMTIAEVPPEAPEFRSGALNGTWVLESGEDDGVKLTPEKVRTARLVIKGPGTKGPEYSLHIGDEVTNGVFSVMTAEDPKTLSVYDYYGPRAKMGYGGVYELDGDTFRYSLAKPGEMSPTEFSKGSMIRIWKRQQVEPLSRPALPP